MSKYGQQQKYYISYTLGGYNPDKDSIVKVTVKELKPKTKKPFYEGVWISCEIFGKGQIIYADDKCAVVKFSEKRVQLPLESLTLIDSQNYLEEQICRL